MEECRKRQTVAVAVVVAVDEGLGQGLLMMRTEGVVDFCHI